MDETTDEGADRRRLQRLFDLLGRTPGEYPVELEVRLRGGRTQLLRLPGIEDIDALVPEIQPLLGVLGTARRIGDEAYARQYVAVAG